MTFDFTGKTAIVTGAGSGIGAAVARELARSGALVIVSDLDEGGAGAVAEQIRSEGGRAHVFLADVADYDEMESLTGFAVKQGGGLHLAVNNAGIAGAIAPTAEYPVDGWRKVIEVNLNGVFYGMRHQIPAMLKSGGGSIVNMASILGSVGARGSSAYTASKHAVVGMTKAAAMEYAAQGVRINAVGPAYIDTPLLEKNLDPAFLKQVGDLHPIGRMGTADEVSALTCFLLSDRAAFITGSYHLVDGGYTAQ
ncbi:SDR family oxidoreductase [Glycocaulis profundi]|nr:SDR family oxidoreductase [Glycocaulis profundi]